MACISLYKICTLFNVICIECNYPFSVFQITLLYYLHYSLLRTIIRFIEGGPFMFDYMSVKETAEKWGLSERRVQILCSNNRIQGVIRINRMWLIPKNEEKPIDRRYILKCEKDGAKE